MLVFESSWTINTKYYTADVSVCVADLHERFSISTIPIYNQLVALVMVFNMNDVCHFLSHISPFCGVYLLYPTHYSFEFVLSATKRFGGNEYPSMTFRAALVSCFASGVGIS